MQTEPPRPAAVLMLLFEAAGEDHIVFTRRTERVATHKGQISLPGGAWEPTDQSLLHTALRETEEELGVSPHQIQVIGELPNVFTAVSNFVIKPFVGRLAKHPEYRPDPQEVAEVIEVPLSVLRNPDIYWMEERLEPGGARGVHFYRYGDHIIWGATARILKQFLETGPSSLAADTGWGYIEDTEDLSR